MLARGLQASRYCKDLLNLDSEILCVTIANDDGDIVAIDWKKGRVPWENNGVKAMQQFEEIQSKLGAWMQIITGLAGQTEPLVGGFERASFIHKNFQLVLLGPKLNGYAIGVLLARSANIDHVVSKIKEITGGF
ncbi:MAG: hypothetical protein OK457_05675 [Thaumarchaeota archaeon]|nr:hypothetical protein [Nitrososphaerota archaeon]